MNSDFPRLPAQNSSTSTTPQDNRSRQHTETWSSTSSSDRDERVRWWRKQKNPMHGRKRSTSSNRQTINPTKMTSATSHPVAVESPYKCPTDCWDAQSVLSLDGAGLQGVFELYVLKYVMDLIVQLEVKGGALSSTEVPVQSRAVDDCAGQTSTSDRERDFLPCHYFDYIIGTGMGGVNAVLLGRLRLSVSEAIEAQRMMFQSIATYINRGESTLKSKTVRQGCTLGMSAALDQIMMKNIGDRKRKGLRDILGNATSGGPNFHEISSTKTLVLAMRYDDENHSRLPHLFRSYDFDPPGQASSLNRNANKISQQVTVKDVCMATSASQDFFKSHKVTVQGIQTKFRDGSEWMLNPSMELYREVDAMHSNVDNPLFCFASIGCGTQKHGIADMTLRTFSPGGILRRKSVYDREQLRVDQVLKSREVNSFRYFRVSGPEDVPDLKPSDRKFLSDELRNKAMEKIRLSAHVYCMNEKETLSSLADTVVRYRQQRAFTPNWKRFIQLDRPKNQATAHTCKICPKGDIERVENVDRDTFIAHARKKHIKGDPRIFESYRQMLEESLVAS